jgi:hypothetical protein
VDSLRASPQCNRQGSHRPSRADSPLVSRRWCHRHNQVASLVDSPLRSPQQCQQHNQVASLVGSLLDSPRDSRHLVRLPPNPQPCPLRSHLVSPRVSLRCNRLASLVVSLHSPPASQVASQVGPQVASLQVSPQPHLLCRRECNAPTALQQDPRIHLPLSLPHPPHPFLQ